MTYWVEGKLLPRAALALSFSGLLHQRLRVAVLEARLEAAEDERDYLRQQVQTLTMAQAVMAQAQKALEPEKKPRRWRWPWEREAKS